VVSSVAGESDPPQAAAKRLARRSEGRRIGGLLVS
jgi:hypothetical protein